MTRWQFRMVAFGAVLTVAWAFPSLAYSPSELTGPQVLEKCRKAYDALQSYQVTTKSTTKTPGRGAQGEPSTATIQFSRPNRLRVDGTLTGPLPNMSNGYTIISDGKSTWTIWSIEAGKWEKMDRVDNAIGAFTGVSEGACATIPALLLRTNWGYPFGHGESIVSKVRRERVNGHFTYRVETKNSPGRATYWVDNKTFLLVKLHEVSHIPDQTVTIPGTNGQAPSQMKIGGTLDTTQTFEAEKINPKLDSKLFARPENAPE